MFLHDGRHDDSNLADPSKSVVPFKTLLVLKKLADLVDKTIINNPYVPNTHRDHIGNILYRTLCAHILLCEESQKVTTGFFYECIKRWRAETNRYW